MGTLRWKKAYVETIPVPRVSAAKERPFIRLVDLILAAKAADPNADTAELEKAIDWLVYDLYGLTDEETAVVADYFWEGSLTEEEEGPSIAAGNEESLKEVRATDGRNTMEELRKIIKGLG